MFDFRVCPSQYLRFDSPCCQFRRTNLVFKKKINGQKIRLNIIEVLFSFPKSLYTFHMQSTYLFTYMELTFTVSRTDNIYTKSARYYTRTH